MANYSEMYYVGCYLYFLFMASFGVYNLITYYYLVNLQLGVCVVCLYACIVYFISSFSFNNFFMIFLFMGWPYWIAGCVIYATLSDPLHVLDNTQIWIYYQLTLINYACVLLSYLFIRTISYIIDRYAGDNLY
jgi:hypothetical protein